MPPLPKGMIQMKGRAGYYYRTQRGGKDVRIKLSDDLAVAKRKLRRLRDVEMLGPATVKQAAKRWLEGPVAQGRSARFAALTKARVEDYLEPLYGYRRLDTFRSEHCREYRARLGEHDLAPQTVRHILSDLRCLLNWCVDEGMIARSPFPRGILPKIQQGPARGLSETEVAALVALPGDVGFEMRVLIGTGMRWGEFKQAQSSWLDRGDFVIQGRTKSRKIRRVPVALSLAREIGQRVGRLCLYANAQTLAKQARKVVLGFTVHRTRHTFAIRYLERQGTVHGLQYLLGHASITTTMLYLRGLPEHAEREARQVATR